MSKLLSVIVPVYNIKEYISQCVESIINQTYKELEIILVDDGSTDGSSLICDEYAQKDSRIKVIHKNNGGLSSARNAGIDISAGDYLAFVDGDDWIDINMYETLICNLEKNDADIVSCAIKYIYEDSCINVISGTSKEEKEVVIKDKKNIFHQLIERDVCTVVQWNKVFKKKIFENIRYPEGKNHEDVYVIHKELYNAGIISYVSEAMYYYRQRQNSIMSLDKNINQIFNAIDGYKERIAFFVEKDCFQAKQEAIYTLYSYIHWKYESNLVQKDKKNCDILWECLRDSAEKYDEISEMSEECKFLLCDRKKFDLKKKKLLFKANICKIRDRFFKIKR